MKTIALLSFLAAGSTAFAATHTYKMSITQDSVVEGKTLKAGNYKIMMDNGSAVIKHGNDTIQVPAKEVTDTNKVASTELLYDNQTNLQEVRFGGTNTKIVFQNAADATQSGT